MNRKNLHKHSLPIVLVLAVAFVLSISLIKHPITDRSTLVRALVTNYVHIERTSNGLARISLDHHAAAVHVPSEDDTAADQLLTIGTDSGKLTRLNFTVQSLDPLQHLPLK